MKVVLINPNTRFNARSVAIPLGIIAIASYLQTKGHRVKILDFTVEKIDLKKEIEKEKPDIAGISVIGHKSLPNAIKISEELKKFNIPVAWGGPLAACIYGEVLESGYAEYVFTGEGELAWEDLLNSLANGTSASEIDGIALIKDGKIHYNGQHKLADLSDFPEMDFSLVNPPLYFQKTFGCERMLHLCSSKGCPNHCIFCYNKDFNLCKYRKRPLAQVMNEIRYLVENHNMDGIYFTDELWAASREELHEYCNAFRESGLKFSWGCQTTIGRFTKEDYQLMYDCGCRWIFFGIESGSKQLLKKMAKNIEFDKIEQSVADCYDSGIVTIAAFIVGLPDETEDDLKLTTDLANRLRTSFYSVNFFYPVPNSALYKRLVNENKFKAPKKPQELFRQRPVEKLQHNVSNLKSLDLKVIRSHYQFRSFMGGNAKKETEDQSRFFFTKKTITEAIDSTLHHGFINFVVQVYYSALEILSVLFYAFCFPGIRKKYNLYKKK